MRHWVINLRRACFEPNSLPFCHQLKFSTGALAKLTEIELHQSRESSIRAYLEELCLEQCKKLQSRRAFDRRPQRHSYALRTSKIIHGQSLKYGLASKGRLGNAIVDLYAKCGDVDCAEKAFSGLEENDQLAWNSILSMYLREAMLGNVVKAFWSMWSSGVGGNQFACAIVLSACGKMKNVELGRQVHCGILKMGFEFDTYCESALIDMYVKCGYVVDARRIFDAALEPDMVSGTAMISGYVHVGLLDEALKIFEEMRRLDCVPDQVAFVTILNACMGLGRLDDACHLFPQIPNPDVVAWNIMISGHAKCGYDLKAVRCFQNMIAAGVRPTRPTFGSVLSAIASIANLEYGLQVHARAMKQGLDSNVYVGSSLINMYSKCQKMDAAKELFNGLDEKNDVLWNTLLGGYAQNGYAREVLTLFMAMTVSGFQPDEYTYTSILSACARLQNIGIGRQLHSIAIKKKFSENVYVANALVDMYAKCGSLTNARKQFELISNPDHVSWNAIIVGYVQDEEEEEAFSLFHRMMFEGIAPDEVSLASILGASANIEALDEGTQIHCFVVKCGLETGLYAGSSLIDMYCKCGIVEAATKVFSCMPERNVVCTNALMSGYAQTNFHEASNLFQCMLSEGLKPSAVTFASLLDACAGNSNPYFGSQIHCFILKLGLPYSDEFLAVSLLGIYMSAQRMEDAALLFSELPNPRSSVIWTAMISGNAQNNYGKEALIWYQEMRCNNAMPDQATFASVLRACSILASLQDGRKLHSLIIHTGYSEDELIGSALVDMYAKCADVRSSTQIFSEMTSKNDVISWNSMIVGLAKNGYAENALKIFDEMKQAEVKPDDVTFLGVLTACSHSGMVCEGREIFNNMVSLYGIHPRVDHCACMIDLYGRWGCLKEAEEFIASIDFETDPMIWSTYLGACRLHGDDIRGQRAAEKLIELEPQNSSAYVLLSNIYATTGNWDGVNSLRRKMKETGVKKFPGCSWIFVKQKTNLFVAGDKFHPSAGRIHALLKDLTALMKDYGYVAELGHFLLDEEQEYFLCPSIWKEADTNLSIGFGHSSR